MAKPRSGHPPNGRASSCSVLLPNAALVYGRPIMTAPTTAASSDGLTETFRDSRPAYLRAFAQLAGLSPVGHADRHLDGVAKLVAAGRFDRLFGRKRAEVERLGQIDNLWARPTRLDRRVRRSGVASQVRICHRYLSGAKYPLRLWTVRLSSREWITTSRQEPSRAACVEV